MVQGRKWLGSPHCAGRVPAAAGAQRAASQPASPAQSRGPAAPTPRSWAFLLAQLSRRNPSPSPCTCFPPTSHPYPCTVPPGQETFSAPFGHLSLSPCPRLSALPPLVSLSACLCLPVSRCPCLCLYLSVSLSPCPCLCLPDSPSVSRSVSSCLPVSPLLQSFASVPVFRPTSFSPFCHLRSPVFLPPNYPADPKKKRATEGFFSPRLPRDLQAQGEDGRSVSMHALRARSGVLLLR